MSDIPEYLQTSVLAQVLNLSEPHCVPPEFCKPDTSVNSKQDFEWLERTLDYWGQFKHDLFELARDGSEYVSEFLYKYKKVAFTLLVLEDESAIHDETNSDALLWMISCILVDDIDFIAYDLVDLPDNACALLLSDVSTLNRLLRFTADFVKRRYVQIDPVKYHENSMLLAARSGNVEILQRLLHPDTESQSTALSTAPYPSILLSTAVVTSAAAAAAASGGHISCLEYLHQHGYSWEAKVSTAAARRGRLDCLRYLQQHGCPWDVRTTVAAAEEGYLDCLKYLHENGCPWHAMTARAAAKHGHVDCLRYLLEKDCPWDKRVAGSASSYLLTASCLNIDKYYLGIRTKPWILQLNEIVKFIFSICTSVFVLSTKRPRT